MKRSVKTNEQRLNSGKGKVREAVKLIETERGKKLSLAGLDRRLRAVEDILIHRPQ